MSIISAKKLECGDQSHKCSNCGRIEKCDYEECVGKVPKCCICNYIEDGKSEDYAIWIKGTNIIPKEYPKSIVKLQMTLTVTQGIRNEYNI